MALQITLPFGKKDNVKNLVFSILIKEYPLKIIELTNFIRKRYGKSVTFQAVRKAILQLVEEGVLIQQKHAFLINKSWVVESKKTLEEIHTELTREKTIPKKMQSIEGEVSVFTFESLNQMMKFWQDLIDDWFRKFDKKDYNMNCYQAAHAWEGLLHLDREKTLMGQLKKKGIRSFILSTGNTPLDRNIRKFYQGIGVNMQIQHSSSSFDRSYYVGTYGDLIVQTQYPEQLVSALETFFKKNQSIEDLDLKALSDIVNKKIKIKLTVIKNLAMAKQINQSILMQ
ncbi:hypothetical protein C4573_03680 [Candidatus Woesearchaeota archaeon]|nr:MAG: hypothetical protein C4573_03680 [Candidatus Woesearchaeota archaeon]